MLLILHDLFTLLTICELMRQKDKILLIELGQKRKKTMKI